jgi:hypothetical protein
MDSNRIFVGVDPSSGGKRLTVAALTSRLEVMWIKAPTIEETVAELASVDEISVAIGGPLRAHSPSAAGETRVSGALKRGKWKDGRTAEAEIHRRGIPIRRTPIREDALPVRMRSAFQLTHELLKRSFLEGRAGRESPRLLLETRPAACAAVLLGRLPFGRETLEGRIQRQLLLLREKVALPDPMDSLEELTAHHLLSGRLSLGGICAPDELDALLAAFTAWRAALYPQRVAWLGRDRDGWICLPVKEILDKYLKSDYHG